MIRLSELKLPLTELPVEVRRAADAPAETDADRQLPPHPIAALRQLAAKALGMATDEIDAVHVFKRSFDARKQNLLVVYIVDVQLKDACKNPRCSHNTKTIRTFKPHPTWHGTHLRMHRATGVHTQVNDRSWWALVLAASLQRWCWRKWGSNRS